MEDDQKDSAPMPPIEPDMPMYRATLAQAQTQGLLGVSAVPTRMTVSEMLLERKTHLVRELAEIERAMALAKDNEGAMQLIDAITKSGVAKREY